MRNTGTPTIAPVGGQLTLPTQQNFAPSPRQQSGRASPIPHTNQGITKQQAFHKINRTLAPGPVAKIVIALQQARF
jgi:hypothetical protein